MQKLLNSSVCGILFLVLVCPRLAPAKEAVESERLSVTNTVKLQQLVGKDVHVVGKISRTSKSKSGHHFLNFYSSQLTLVCFKPNLAKFKSGGPADLYRDKEVEVSGKLELFKGKLQIKLSQPDQIGLAGSTGKGPPAKQTLAKQPPGIQLKKVGLDTWVSPAGLRYTGRDPAGLTRVQHVARHTRDEPRRAGSHGVFDGGQDVAFAVIDEAWTLAQKKKTKPRAERDRSSLLVSMGRRVGYLGGRTGKQRGNPPLTRVFIVFQTGTKNIVTAFPR